MTSKRHVFHTKHDFSPELGWSAFQLLAEIGSDGITLPELQSVAAVVASPLTRRSDLNKLLSAMQDVDLIIRDRDTVHLSEAGKALGEGFGHYEEGFRAAVHCIYSWKWIWHRDTKNASPSWSYREVLRQILTAGIAGITPDEIVLRVVSAAERFNAEKVSFSRSSVSGVTMWLEAQIPMLIQKKGRRIFTQNFLPLAGSIRLHLAALCALNGGEAALDSDNIQLLAECFIVPAEKMIGPITDFALDSHEFLLVPGTPNRVIFNGSEDQFIEWIVKGPKRNWCPPQIVSAQHMNGEQLMKDRHSASGRIDSDKNEEEIFQISPIADTFSGIKAREDPEGTIVHYEGLAGRLWLSPKVRDIADIFLDRVSQVFSARKKCIVRHSKIQALASSVY